MLGGIQHSYRLRRLQRRQRLTGRYFDELIKNARKEGKNEFDIAQLQSDDFDELRSYDDDISQLNSQFLMRQAQAYLIPIPEFDSKSGTWEQSRTSSKWRLSQIEQAKLRSAIRAEKRERWEAWSRWIPVISALTGLLGLVVAILAILWKK